MDEQPRPHPPDVVGPRGRHLVRLLPHVGPDFCQAEIRFAAS